MGFGWFVEKYLAEGKVKDAEALAAQMHQLGLYKLDQAPIILSRRSAKLPVFNDDTRPENKITFSDRITKDVNKSFSMYDVEQFYAMQLMGSRRNQDTANDIYLRMAFYMYIADKVSLHPNASELSFLAALRKVGFNAIPRDKNNPSKEQLLAKFKEALDLLGLQELHEQADSWFNHNKFFVAGHEHSTDGNDFKGHYTELARFFCQLNPYIMQVQECIDYAYGNKDAITQEGFINGFANEDAALLNHTQNMYFDLQRTMQIIRGGEEKRKQDLDGIAKAHVPVMADDEYELLVSKRAERLKKMAKYLAPEIMQIIINKQIILSESTSQSGIANIYPSNIDDPTHLHGLTPQECEMAKFGSRSLSLTSYDMIMVSPGFPRLKEWPQKEGVKWEDQERMPDFTEDEVLQHNALSASHELFHQITNWVYNAKITRSGDKKTMYATMIDLVNKLSAKLNSGEYDEFKQHPAMTYIPKSIEGVAVWPVDILQVINPTSYLYGNYYPAEEGDTQEALTIKSNKRAEEVAANIFGLIYSEMRMNSDLRAENNAFYSGEIEIPELKQLVELLHEFMKKGLELSKPKDGISLG